MGKASTAPGGYGSLSGGYRLVWCRVRKRSVREHRLVWESAHGPIPAGMDLHHLDGDRLNNALGNLQLVTHLEHKRIHSGCFEREGVTWKPCSKCATAYPISEYYQRGPEGVSPWCKPCIRQAIKANKLKRRLARWKKN